VDAIRGDRTLIAVLGVFLAGVAVRMWFLAAQRPAFFGFYDAGAYIGVAAGDHGSPVRPVGYPIFLKAVHVLPSSLTATIVLQHALGVASAALLYLATVRMTTSRLVALIPAAMMLFDGLIVVLEHTLLSETLFIFLVAGSTYAAVRSLDDSRWWVAGSTGLAAAAGVTRPVGLLLVPIPLLASVLWRPEPLRMRLAAVGLGAGAAAGVLAVYLGLLAIAPGSPVVSISPSSGRVLYSRVAPFADCDAFDPPAGTRPLCQDRPASARPGTNYYLWDPTSPAWRHYGAPPTVDDRLGSFALAAIRHQPGEYASAVVEDFKHYFEEWNRYVDVADNHEPYVVDNARRYYGDVGGGRGASGGPLLSYARAVFVSAGWPMRLLMILPALSLVVARGRSRQGAAICAVTGWALLIGAVATANYDPRYGVVAIGSLVAASAPAVLSAASGLHRLPRAAGGSAAPGSR
jgi:hypothetical protein